MTLSHCLFFVFGFSFLYVDVSLYSRLLFFIRAVELVIVYAASPFFEHDFQVRASPLFLVLRCESFHPHVSDLLTTLALTGTITSNNYPFRNLPPVYPEDTPHKRQNATQPAPKTPLFSSSGPQFSPICSSAAPFRSSLIWVLPRDFFFRSGLSLRCSD